MTPAQRAGSLLCVTFLFSMAPAHAQAATRRFKGSMGDSLRIALELDIGATVSGHYEYLRHKKPIALAGTLDAANRIVLIETDDRGAHTGEFAGTLKGSSLAGTWSSGDRKKTLPFSLKEIVTISSIGGGFEVVPVDLDSVSKRYTILGELPAIEGLGDTKAQAAFNRTVRDALQGVINDFIGEANEADDKNSSDLQISYVACGLASRWVSIDVAESTNIAGTAHPSLDHYALTYDLVARKPIKLGSLFKRKSQYEKHLFQLAVRELKRAFSADTEDLSWTEDVARGQADFNLTAEGLGLNYGRSGPFPGASIVIPWTDLAEWVDPNAAAGPLLKQP